MNTTSNPITYKGVAIYQMNDGWSAFISDNNLTHMRSQRHIKEVITNSLASWAVARGGKLVAK